MLFPVTWKVKIPSTYLLAAWALAAVLIFCACTENYLMAPPALPPAYYDCVEASPQQLVDAYYAPYADINGAQRLYAGKVFVFKNIELTHEMLRDAGEGYIWAGGSVVKCYCLNIGELKRYRAGDRLDIIGVNKGISDNSSVLVFTDCYVMPAGTVALPASGTKEILQGY